MGIDEALEHAKHADPKSAAIIRALVAGFNCLTGHSADETKRADALEAELVEVAKAVGHYEKHEGHYRRGDGAGMAARIRTMNEDHLTLQDARYMVENADETLPAKHLVRRLWPLLGCVERDAEQEW